MLSDNHENHVKKKPASLLFPDERDATAYPIYKKTELEIISGGERWISLSDGGDKRKLLLRKHGGKDAEGEERR